VRFVPLGDSYTIGTSVPTDLRWPNQLVARLGAEASARGEQAPLELAGNPAVNGFTSRDVIVAELPLLDTLKPELASLLIGTNDVLQGIGEDAYRRNVDHILDDLERRVGGARIFGLTSPDYTVTPAGAEYGVRAIRSRQLRERNQLFTAIFAARGLPVVDIHDLSLLAATNRSLVAFDGLHPSGSQYALWVDRLLPVVRGIIGMPE
jgi:acyl-CoA thioesterase I